MVKGRALARPSERSERFEPLVRRGLEPGAASCGDTIAGNAFALNGFFMLFMPFHALCIWRFGAPQRQRDAMAGVPDIAEQGFFGPPAISNTQNSFHEKCTVLNY